MGTINPEITRPALRYYGGKFRLAKWIIGQFPPHVCYVEPFGGAGSIILRKQPSYHEIYNDLDGEVVNFFRVLRERGDELIHEIELTPWSREEQRLSFIPSNDDLERARRLYVRAWQTHGGGRTQWKSGWRYQKGTARGSKIVDDWSHIKYLWAVIARLKQIQIENGDGLEVIKRFDREDTLYYVDPPYLADIRSLRWRKKAYTCEVDDSYHVKLGRLLNNIKGMAIISGKPCELYRDLYDGWKILQRTSPTDFGGNTVECLWISPKAEFRQRQIGMSLPE